MHQTNVEEQIVPFMRGKRWRSSRKALAPIFVVARMKEVCSKFTRSASDSGFYFWISSCRCRRLWMTKLTCLSTSFKNQQRRANRSTFSSNVFTILSWLNSKFYLILSLILAASCSYPLTFSLNPLWTLMRHAKQIRWTVFTRALHELSLHWIRWRQQFYPSHVLRLLMLNLNPPVFLF